MARRSRRGSVMRVFFLLFYGYYVACTCYIPRVLAVCLFGLLYVFVRGHATGLFRYFSVAFERVQGPFFCFFSGGVSGLSIEGCGAVFSTFDTTIIHRVAYHGGRTPRVFCTLVCLIMNRLEDCVLFGALPYCRPLCFHFYEGVDRISGSTSGHVST